MKKYFYLIAAATSVTIIFLSCTKVGGGDENPDAIDQGDKIFPVITMSKPLANQVYTNADSIIVQGKTTDDRVVYNGKVLITNDATNG